MERGMTSSATHGPKGVEKANTNLRGRSGTLKAERMEKLSTKDVDTVCLLSGCLGENTQVMKQA